MCQITAEAQDTNSFINPVRDIAMDHDDSSLSCEMAVWQDAGDKPTFELQVVIAAWEGNVFVLQS